ncbi:cryptochrome/photolyase family protein [bacterium endosymbiont of Pedicinus badii]|uniref:cryptochrome/photolyase family protein n=1 Tax=bacterium endosymbiont of Pedicinus badii TaxID=1719126 RepID=UPI0009B9C586|nr:FAD-binding domain-containing protein [bacterium endosymbiont of Pedicinus badii]OQM34317.1 hypothetical protein AOQ89_00260 [bacterium endosymbiont of Pedicinus badii]
MKKILVWFRNELRIHDNPALFLACQEKNAQVESVYIAPIEQWKEHNMSKIQCFFIWKNLKIFSKNLQKIGIKLNYFSCKKYRDQIKIIYYFCLKKKIGKIFYNKEYSVNEIKRDQKIKKILKRKKIKIIDLRGNLIFSPGKILSKKNIPYKKYYFFKKSFISLVKKKKISCFPVPKMKKEIFFSDCIPPFYKSFQKNRYKLQNFGEKEAIKKLKNFCRYKIKHYHKANKTVNDERNSQISAFLSIGVISPRKCLYEVTKRKKYSQLSEGEKKWIEEIIWREFYKHTLFFYPKFFFVKHYISWTENIRWRKNRKIFKSWTNGKTGCPIVDASMRMLKKKGWINNRLRMICASFLVKNLFIDWRMGEKYFMSKLIDGDVALNNGNWQWIASTGINSSPYYRIFNPYYQSKKIDKKGKFIKKWIPELNQISTEHLHEENFLKKIKNYSKIPEKDKYSKEEIIDLYEKNKIKI